MRIRRALAVMLVATLTWSCTNGEIEPEAQPSPPTSPEVTETTVVPPGGFGSSEALVSGLGQRGFECSDLTELEQKGSSITAFARCDPDGERAQRLFIYIFADTTQRDRWTETFRQSGATWLYGPNWIIASGGPPAAARERLERVRLAIGGEFPEP